jgi:hypothetical protein
VGGATHQAVADARHGDDPLFAARAGAKLLAQRGDLDGDIAFLDRHTGPDALQHLGLGDDLALSLEHGLEHHQRLGAERNGLAVAPQFTARRQNKWAEPMLCFVHGAGCTSNGCCFVGAWRQKQATRQPIDEITSDDRAVRRMDTSVQAATLASMRRTISLWNGSTPAR